MSQPEIIPWIADQPTKYSTDEYYRQVFDESAAHVLKSYVDYVLWECSTEFMVSHGLPTDADVRTWVEWLENRVDSHTVEIQDAIRSCREYTKE